MNATETLIGKQAMNSGPLRMMDGKWVEGQRTPRLCACCKAPSVFIDLDNAKARVMSCDDCGAMEVISKGNGSGWWYHGTRMPDQWPAQFLDGLYVAEGR